jgi:hypothetical protein
MSGGQENSRRQQCSTASERRLTTDLHQQEHNVGVKVSIQLAICDSARRAHSEAEYCHSKECGKNHSISHVFSPLGL